MHVHTVHSGMCSIPVLRRICRESYNDPQALYETLKSQGMDLVTVTDHDSIDAAEPLRRHPDFFLSEEVTCRLPSGTEIHVGVYDINERQHMEIQRRRHDFVSLRAYLLEQNLLFSANHIFSSLTGRRVAEDFSWFENSFPAFETRNGCMLERSNRAASKLAGRSGKAVVAGSDAHSMYSLGSCWTHVPGARTKDEFLSGLRAAQGRAHGESGSYWKLTRDVLWIGARLVSERPFILPAAVLALLVPVITLVNYVMEVRFAEGWASHLMSDGVPEQRPEGVAA